jgi:hypothetical protein
MTGPDLEQRQEADTQQPQPMSSPATSAAITVVPHSTFSPEPGPTPWKRWLAMIAGIGALGGLGWLLWWTLLRTPKQPFVLDLSPSASEYAVANQATPLLNWQISHPQQLEALILRTYTPRWYPDWQRHQLRPVWPSAGRVVALLHGRGAQVDLPECAHHGAPTGAIPV